jgi:prepilin signal peptidase PulO-like enzyme (type II secretory pathway)
MTLILIFLFILGIVFGSFISALTWRYPRGISVNKGRSICPNCKHQISMKDNIPLFSYLFLGGKCRNCKKHISLRYPLIEFTTGIEFVVIGYLIWITQGLSLQAVYSIIFTLVLFLILEAIFIIDLEHQIIPDSFVFIAILFALFLIHASLFQSIFAGFFAATLLLLIHLLTRGRGMGLGDVKFAVLGGLLVGSKLLLIWLFLAFLTGAIIGIILILGKKAGMKSQIAFGPFLIIAIPLALIYGEKILFWIHLT